jgi:hypothetical protein
MRFGAESTMAESAPPPKLVARLLVGGEGWYVQVDWQDFEEQVGAFASRAEAEEWIATKSEDWLLRYRRPPTKSGS